MNARPSRVKLNIYIYNSCFSVYQINRVRAVFLLRNTILWSRQNLKNVRKRTNEKFVDDPTNIIRRVMTGIRDIL